MSRSHGPSSPTTPSRYRGPRPGRTTIAGLITGFALGLPCVAWYVAGSRSVSQDAERLREAARTAAATEAGRLAHQLSLRLESLRLSESRRRATDYLGPADSAPSDPDCPTPGDSPLAEGPADPLVWTHFQIDAVGQLSLPTLGAGGPRVLSNGADGDSEMIQRAILEQLECAAHGTHTALARGIHDGSARSSGVPAATAQVGPFRWQTLRVDEQPALIASRDVTTPSEVRTQGFVVRTRELTDLVSGSRLPVALRPGLPIGQTEVAVSLEGETWTVAVDAAAELAQAADRGRAAASGFRRRFGAGLVAALLAGSLVVAMVRQADLLARQRARFAATAAHELRTPLAGLRMYGEMLADGSGEPGRERSYARRIAMEADRLGRVVSNLLAFSRLERGRLGVQLTHGDLGAVVRESAELLRPGLAAGGATLELCTPDRLPEVRFDRDAVHQILQNLVDNADKYGRRDDGAIIRVELAPHPRGVSLSVTDRGAGVPAAVRRRLFRPFSREGTANTKPGLGLGLALVDGLARAQDATLSYEPLEQGGSKFSVVFASDRTAVASAGRGPAPPSGPGAAD